MTEASEAVLWAVCGPLVAESTLTEASVDVLGVVRVRAATSELTEASEADLESASAASVAESPLSEASLEVRR